MRVSQDGVSKGTYVDGQTRRDTPAPAKRAELKSANIDMDDLFEPVALKNDASNSKTNHFNDVCSQMLDDHVDRPKTRVLLQVVARIFGLTFARCMSNVIAHFTGCSWLDARRDYAILPKDALIVNSKGDVLAVDGTPLTAEKLANQYKPQMYTISEDQSIDDNLGVVEMRYEVLPPRLNKNSYSIVYYIRRERELMPVVFLGMVLDVIRPFFWGSKSEWSAVEIDIDRDTGEPNQLDFESTNYTGDPLSYEITSANDLHLPVKVIAKDKKWSHTLYQKDNRAKSREIQNPFEKDKHPNLVFVNWNGDLDLAGSAAITGYKMDGDVAEPKRLYKMKDAPLQFLDIMTYRKEGLDLRNHWLKRRKKGQCQMSFPARKDPKDFRVVNLISGELPSLLNPAAV